ncbi:unnamed protein product [Triticum turgidum subsp. durum]|uniref:SLC26A/SulP transporter domain-containing protein n=1 Tax=Triticum turgidum subsp. durum TaxID=4567 RepID=A0A9R0VUK5_TRITD|nr:unnamed protein product [Triticum turgidum subsp. durum]
MPRTILDGGEDFNGDISRTGSHHQTDDHGYKVRFPPAKGLFTELAEGVKETFFPDDPLREYKDQPRSKKLWFGLVHLFPVLDWARSYTFGMFKGDFIAGLTIASLCIPQEEIDPVKNPHEYSRLAFTATFFAGITQAMLGFFRLGFIIEFLSHAAIVGFMAGAAITIGLQQLKGFLGIAKFTKQSDIISVMESLILANPGSAVIQKLQSAKFTKLIGDDKIFLSVGDAVKKFAPKSALNV